MTSTTTKTKKTIDDYCAFRKDFPDVEVELGHVPAYDEEQESEIPENWYHPIKD